MDNNFELASAAVSDRGLSEKRPQNEDSYLAYESKGIFAVADGVGGAQAGDVASQMAMEILGEAFANLPETDDAEDTMRIAIERANSAIFQMSRELPQLSTMATTIVAVHINGNIATIGHVGDSRLYRLDGVGNLYRETDDHSVVAEEVRAGRMTAEQAENHPSKNIISRALGAEESVDIDLKTIMIEPYTAFLLCSDGITRHVTDAEIGELLRSGMEPGEICARLKELCYDRGAEDNLTAVVVDVTSEISRRFSRVQAAPRVEAEEATVATARSPFESKVEAGADQEAAVESAEEEEENTVAAAAVGASYATSEPSVTTEPYEADTVHTEPAEPVPAPAVVHRPEPARIPFTVPEPEAGGSFGRILASAALLVLGAIIGAGGYYLLQKPVETPQPVAAPPQITEMKTSNPPLTAYEENRRNVDKNPAAYLTASGNNAQDAEDYYLRGRAYMLTGKYWEAKKDFAEAKNRLAQADPMNSGVLATDIALAIAVINNGPAQEAFARDLSSAGPVDANTAASPLPTP